MIEFYTDLMVGPDYLRSSATKSACQPRCKWPTS